MSNWLDKSTSFMNSFGGMIENIGQGVGHAINPKVDVDIKTKTFMWVSGIVLGILIIPKLFKSKVFR